MTKKRCPIVSVEFLCFVMVSVISLYYLHHRSVKFFTREHPVYHSIKFNNSTSYAMDAACEVMFSWYFIYEPTIVDWKFDPNKIQLTMGKTLLTSTGTHKNNEALDAMINDYNTYCRGR